MNISELAAVENHLFSHVRIIAVPKYEPVQTGPVREVITSQLSIQKHPTDPKRFLADLRISFNKEASSTHPYVIDIGCVTQVTVLREISEAETQQVAARAAHELLLPAVREMILFITSRQPWGGMSIGLSDLDFTKTETETNPEPAPTKAPPARKKTIRRKKAIAEE